MSAALGGTVIIGGGIIGISTAYYLALAQNGSGSDIVIVDRAPELFLGASGVANGVLGDYGFAPEAAALGTLSWGLLNDLAAEHNGRERWGFSKVICHHPRTSDHDQPVPGHPMPPWFKYTHNFSDELESDPSLAARLMSKEFCQFLLEEVEKMNVRVLRSSRVTRVSFESGSIVGVDVQHEGDENTDLKVRRLHQEQIPCKSLVIAAGPWSQRVLESMFPAASTKIPFDQDGKSGNWIQLKLAGYENTRNFCDQVYLRGITDKRLDLTDFLNGHIYVGGYLTTVQELPDRVTDVKAQPEAIAEMMDLALGVLPASADVSIVAKGRAYRPVLSTNRPIITKLTLEELGIGTGREVGTIGGVYLSTGHGSDGITLGPGSGLVMSELIRGVSPSANISGLGMPSSDPKAT